jgi:hypothetical protein
LRARRGVAVAVSFAACIAVGAVGGEAVRAFVGVAVGAAVGAAVGVAVAVGVAEAQQNAAYV